MKSLLKKIPLSFNFVLLLCSIMPITENQEVIFYLNVVLGVVFLILWIVGEIFNRKFVNILQWSVAERIYSALIAVCGIMIRYSMDLPISQILMWWFILVVSIGTLVIPDKK